MIIREAKPAEIRQLLVEGHKCWHKGRSLEKYSADNRKEEEYGTRYVAEVDGQVVSSLILLRFGEIITCPAYGIGSVLTMPGFKKKGYASELIKAVLQQLDSKKALVFLYSEINPLFYDRLGFHKLPDRLQRNTACSCMVLCQEEAGEFLIKAELKDIPDYF
ncbi:hypothetical protein acsn021_16590 [Anaerocolumna cellulosilytica]|uniref:Uncharacterized protein n=1 Tax=Anaerocolumna cellulosilytica TaxID=433286 RepID=A0A6S6R3Y3_9FIRM|nr:GNAT family N-acetyltransferase [Anaerocolumna cellulosilytica]MBB5197282.1 putative acetyltransferase [Anaerocolumna cellulosilytica]BCJ94090.1 hypothetical protein acsn021_16590 [Anaerocolumna cellulosilytica]